MFSPTSYPIIFVAVALTVLAFAAAVRLQSWPLWLVALTLTIASLAAMWFLREPERIAHTVMYMHAGSFVA